MVGARAWRPGTNSPDTPGQASKTGLGERGFDGLELVALMLEKACEDLVQGPLPVAEPEAAVRRGRLELRVGQQGDSPEGLACCCEVFDEGVEIDVVGRVLVVVSAGVVPGGVRDGPALGGPGP